MMQETKAAKEEIVIRPAGASDLPLIWQMLAEAAAAHPEIRDMPKEAILSLGKVRKYAEGWGKHGDIGFVAKEKTGRSLGAAWLRLFSEDSPGYGFVGSDVPELTIGVIPQARGKGVGSALMRAIIEEARARGFRAISLNVGRDNPSVALYSRFGFKDAGVSSPEEPSVTMMLDLAAHGG